MNQRELDLGLAGKSTSWHSQFKHSAWIFVGGLPYDLTEGDVVCVFSQYGELVNINLIREKSTGKSKGFCFICYEDQRSTILAVDNLNGIKVLGRTLRVDHVSDYKIPKEHENDDEITKQVQAEGIAPRASSEEEDDVPPVIVTARKAKKEKKERKKKHERDKEGKREKKKLKLSSKCDLEDNTKYANLKKHKRHDSSSDVNDSGVKDKRRDKRKISVDSPSSSDSSDNSGSKLKPNKKTAGHRKKSYPASPRSISGDDERDKRENTEPKVKRERKDEAYDKYLHSDKRSEYDYRRADTHRVDRHRDTYRNEYRYTERREIRDDSDRYETRGHHSDKRDSRKADRPCDDYGRKERR